MGLLDFWKKKEKNEFTSACLGVMELFPLKKTDQFLIIGHLKGKIEVGTSLQLCNPDEGFDSLGELVVEKLSNGNHDVLSLIDEPLAHVIVASSELLTSLKKGSVLHTRDIDEGQRLSSYTDALYRAFIKVQAGDMSNEDYLRVSLDDSIEILRLFLWECHQRQEEESEEDYQSNLRKIAHLQEVVRDKLLDAKSIYVIYSQLTGEPHMFSETLDGGEAGYLCTDPLIHVLTRRWYTHFKETVDQQPNIEVRLIENGENREGIKNFLGSSFYLNGALGVILNSEDTCIKAQNLVAKPDFSDLPEIQTPVTNPDVVRWLLLMGQMGKPATKSGELVYQLYYGFLSREIPKATFLVPMQPDKNFPETNDEAREVVVKQEASFKLPTRKGKENRNAISIFTDWKRLRMVFGDEWSGMIEPAGGMISIFDYIINGTQYPEAGCYVSQQSFEEMKKISDKFNDSHK
ncbi:SseB family protein [Streptococcus orisratti]|uniref:SseB family protein n=1 Tax=Streptococcus orisratti TaxID=114652 RepID=UPI000364BC39|nr:SseB family protein [Streptococcus orisratti]